MSSLPEKDPHRILIEEGHRVDEALRLGVREAALHHKPLGIAMVIERDGETVEVSADEVLAETSVVESPPPRERE
jgi:hypothetical protein